MLRALKSSGPDRAGGLLSRRLPFGLLMSCAVKSAVSAKGIMLMLNKTCSHCVPQ